MYIAICDDERECSNAVVKLLQEYMTPRHMNYDIYQFSDGESLVEAYKRKIHFDLIFLDIFMGTLDGIDTATEIRKLGGTAEIVFLTTSRDFAVESYRVSALSYLLKPARKEEFHEVMEKFLGKYRPVKVQVEDCIFAVSDLVYAESFDKKLFLHFLDGSTQGVRARFEDLIDQLQFPNFLHCHRCYIVNLDHVRKVEDGFFLTVTNETVLIRQKEFHAIKKLYYQYVLSR